MIGNYTYKPTSELIVRDQSVGQIIDAIKSNHELQKKNYDLIAKQFWQGDALSTCKYLFKYCKENIEYKVEPDSRQTVKSLPAIFYQKIGDCKHYASFITGVINALNRQGYDIPNAYYYFAGYDPNYNDVHHVFAAIKLNGSEVFIDPVLKRFDDHSKTIYVTKKVHDNMSRVGDLYHISGIDNSIGKNFFQQLAHSFDVNFQNVKKGVNVNTANLKKAANVNLANLQKGMIVNTANLKKAADVNFANAKKTFLKLNPLSALSRNSFLALLKMNAFNMAHRLYEKKGTDKNFAARLNRKWEDMGGDLKALNIAIDIGFTAYAYRNKINVSQYKKSKGISGVAVPAGVHIYFQKYCHEWPHYTHLSDFGKPAPKKVGEPVSAATIATLVTAASGIIAALAAFLKEAKWKGKNDVEAAANAGTNALSAAASAATNFVPGSQNTVDVAPITLSDGTKSSIMQAQVTTDANGNQYVDLKPGDALNSDGSPKQSKDYIQEVKNYFGDMWENHKGLILLAVGAVVLFKFAPDITTKKGRRK